MTVRFRELGASLRLSQVEHRVGADRDSRQDSIVVIGAFDDARQAVKWF
jgi:hypothetical protein